jgi:hypothetical protein
MPEHSGPQWLVRRSWGERIPWLSCLLLTWSFVACGGGSQPSRDLGRALDGGIGRALTSPTWTPEQLSLLDVRHAFPENDALLHQPRGMCWLGSVLLVADRGDMAIRRFDARAVHLGSMGREGEGPGEFRSLWGLTCAPDGRRFAVTDPVLARVSFFDANGQFLYSTQTPDTPGGWPFVGEITIGRDGLWYATWLHRMIGPVLRPEEWEGVRLIRGWTESGDQIAEFGEPLEYENSAMQQALNEPDLAIHSDTLWLLIKGSAMVQPFSTDGKPAGRRIYLPVYERGMEPTVATVGAGGVPTNGVSYQPNVGGIAIVQDSLFVVVRYMNWHRVLLGDESEPSYWDVDSYLEILDRAGRAIAGFPVPGRLEEVASDGQHTVALRSRSPKDGTGSVWVAVLPEFPASR